MNNLLNAAEGEVKIRMYRPGLGDCFLLAFYGKDKKTKYMLIDCGVLMGTSDSENKMKDIANSIKDATGGHLHVLVVTHEHWDHISGFSQAKGVFQEITVDQVWFGWTEDENNALAKELGMKKNFYLKALKLATDEINRFNKAESFRLNNMLEFYGEVLSATSMMSTAGIMGYLKEKGEEEPKYCYPGDLPLSIPDVEDIRIYVLGPPESRKLIRKSRPSKRNSEVYLTDVDTDLFDSFSSEIISRYGTDKTVSNNDSSGARYKKYPFDEQYHFPIDEESDFKSFFDKHYKNTKNRWREIDNKWMDVASDLALKLDSHTNNTCLVLAIELVGSEKVLLFPGDAQVGNWLGWEDLTWRVGDKNIKVEDLLERTVLYKVGHHGSHNATLREKGLELMTNSELMSMIPVDRKMAKKKKWKMPYKPLYDRLKQRCKKRVLRVDRKVPKRKPSNVNRTEWNHFTDTITEENKLFFELKIK